MDAQSVSLCAMRVGVCPEVGLEGWLRWCAHPLVVFSAGSMHSPQPLSPTPCFPPNSSEVEVVCLVFLYLVVHNLPNCTCTQLFLVLFNFFVLCAGTAAKSPSSPPVLSPLVACSLAPTYLQLLLRRTGKGKRKKHQVRPLKNCCFCWSS